jgi:AcrR family transcriptional regulator
VSPTPAPTARPGGRSARNRSAVHDAVYALITEGGLPAVTVPAVAERSGVHSSSVYRRWGTIEELLLDVVLETSAQTIPTTDTGSLRGDLDQFVRHAVRALRGPIGSALSQVLLTLPVEDGRPARRQYWARRHEALQPLFERAAARGEEVRDVEQLLEDVLAPLYFRLFVTARPIDDAFLNHLLDRAVPDPTPSEAPR